MLLYAETIADDLLANLSAASSATTPPLRVAEIAVNRFTNMFNEPAYKPVVLVFPDNFHLASFANRAAPVLRCHDPKLGHIGINSAVLLYQSFSQWRDYSIDLFELPRGDVGY
jgi:hypothetical protein